MRNSRILNTLRSITRARKSLRANVLRMLRHVKRGLCKVLLASYLRSPAANSSASAVRRRWSPGVSGHSLRI
jgi:hypothetical protein